jgi:hypothetical protein
MLAMFDPDAGMRRINRGLIYLGACLIAGIRLARQSQVNVRVIPTRMAIEEFRGSCTRDFQQSVWADSSAPRK